MQPNRSYVSFRVLVHATAVCLLVIAVIAGTFPSVRAQDQGPVFFTVASGMVTMGRDAPAWYAAAVSVPPGAEAPDPAAGTEGFLLVIRGTVAVANAQANGVALLQAGSALFVPETPGMTFTALSGEASFWRVAVTSADAEAPLSEGEGVSRPLSTIGEADQAAGPDAVRAIELRIAAFEPGAFATLGDEGWTAPLVVALAGEGVLGDGSTVSEGRVVTRSTSGTPVDVSAGDGPAVIGYVSMSPSIDPATLGGGESTTGAGGTGNEQGEVPASPSAGDTGNEDPGASSPPTEEPTEAAPDTSDADGDGLTADEEAKLGTNPSRPDTDEDGLSDGQEVNDYGTDSKALDTDGDGVTDGDEAFGQYGAISPTNADSDYDGLSDGDELFLHHTNPVMSDTDVDGEGDGAEIAANRDPLVFNDRDGDFLGDGLELYYGTNPDNPDSDEDQLTDTYELFTTGTDPNLFDTDGDGAGDGVENASGTDPFDPASHP